MQKPTDHKSDNEGKKYDDGTGYRHTPEKKPHLDRLYILNQENNGDTYRNENEN
jgi:hypothetical protein